MRLIVLFFLSFGAFAQTTQEGSDEAAENVTAQRQGALTAIYHQIYGDTEIGGDSMDGESFGEFVQSLANCTYEGQHEVSQVVDGLERTDCSAVLQGAFDDGVSNGNVQDAIEQASHSEAAQADVDKP